MSKTELSIGALSKLASCSVSTIRYYEQTGLIPEAERSLSGHRYYQERDVQRLAFVRRCRELDFPIEQIRLLMPLLDNRERQCGELRDLAHEQLMRVRSKLDELTKLENTLTDFVKSCDTDCPGGVAKDCTIIENLSKPNVISSGHDETSQRSCCSL